VSMGEVSACNGRNTRVSMGPLLYQNEPFAPSNFDVI
jgi:hypothetical protein